MSADNFHERTNRCLGGGMTDHEVCARIEEKHQTDDHSDCLLVEDGFTEADVWRAAAYLDGPGYDGAATTVEEYLRAHMVEPDVRPDLEPQALDVEGEVMVEVLAEVLARALRKGKAEVVTTADGRWWLTMDLFSISRFERDVVERIVEQR